MNFKDELQARTAEANEVIKEYLPRSRGFSSELADAMSYSLMAGGKRIRPVLMKAVFDLFEGEGWIVEPFMAAIEMIHTHSLVHDDLPAIDNDDYRRGRLTTHKVYGENMGVLAGDALLNYAYETMLQAFGLTEDHEKVWRAMRVIANKTGLNGMLGGQCVDVRTDGRPKSDKMLEYIYQNKTSALIEASMMAGAMLAGADKSDVALMEKAGRMIGLAFQIRDDILDITGDEKKIGKPLHSDERNHKITYVTIHGVEASMLEVLRFTREASVLISSIGGDDEFILFLIQYLMSRDK
ncbi:MAG: polyprenyl synthetase family protein [Blautia sp.]|nr:polyprenyl synthetase family protein [Blautia sp.]